MQAQMTIRLPKILADGLEEASARLGLKKSDLARMAIREFLGSEESVPVGRPYEKLRGLIGSVESGIGDLGSAHREHLIKRLREGA